VDDNLATGSDVTALIRTELPKLSESLAKVGRFVLSDPRAIAHCSAAELARRAGTSQATVTRFCHAVGLESYQELLLMLAREQGRTGASPWGNAQIGPDIGPDDSLRHVVAVVGNADLQAVQHTLDRIDLDAIERAAQALAHARRIDVYGVGGSGSLARETEMHLYRIGCDVRSWTEVHGAATSAALLTPADVAIAISHSGNTRETAEPLELARDRGATTVALTNDPRSPVARGADIRLITSSMETSFRPGSMGARHSAMVLIDVLYIRVAQLTYSRASASLRLTSHIADEHAVRRGRALPGVLDDLFHDDLDDPVPLRGRNLIGHRQFEPHSLLDCFLGGLGYLVAQVPVYGPGQRGGADNQRAERDRIDTVSIVGGGVTQGSLDRRFDIWVDIGGQPSRRGTCGTANGDVRVVHPSSCSRDSRTASGRGSPVTCFQRCSSPRIPSGRVSRASSAAFSRP
jgi:DNA-binding MurR/RpiR family transcriptional regulator